MVCGLNFNPTNLDDYDYDDYRKVVRIGIGWCVEKKQKVKNREYLWFFLM